METLLTIIVSILPIYLVCIYVYKKDNNREPKKLLRKLFIYGMLICLPAAYIEISLEPFFKPEENMDLITLFLYVFISIAFIEEIFKWFVTYNVSYKHPAFDEIYDAIVYAVYVSLGFACFENFFYVMDSGVVTGVIRAVTAIPGHASDAIIMGNFLGLAKLADINNNRKLNTRYLILSILAPTLAHTFYDYCLYSANMVLLAVFVVFVIAIYIYSIKKIKRVSSNNQNFHSNVIVQNNVKYCPRCGSREEGNYCRICGTKL